MKFSALPSDCLRRELFAEWLLAAVALSYVRSVAYGVFHFVLPRFPPSLAALALPPLLRLPRFVDECHSASMCDHNGDWSMGVQR